jgi:hypothetical protein
MLLRHRPGGAVIVGPVCRWSPCPWRSAPGLPTSTGPSDRLAPQADRQSGQRHHHEHDQMGRQAASLGSAVTRTPAHHTVCTEISRPSTYPRPTLRSKGGILIPKSQRSFLHRTGSCKLLVISRFLPQHLGCGRHRPRHKLCPWTKFHQNCARATEPGQLHLPPTVTTYRPIPFSSLSNRAKTSRLPSGEKAPGMSCPPPSGFVVSRLGTPRPAAESV